MLLGKAVRLERIFDRNTGRTIIVPMDHGVTVGPIYGLVDLKGTVNEVAEGGANAVLMHKGLPRCTHRGAGRDIGLIVHLSASTALSPFPNAKVMVGSVEDALRLGADAVSVHVNLGDETEGHMLQSLGEGLYAYQEGREGPITGTVEQGALEMSNVDLTGEISLMMQAVRQYQSCQQMVQMVDSTLDKAVNEIGRL